MIDFTQFKPIFKYFATTAIEETALESHVGD